jgi:hypothetical protein
MFQNILICDKQHCINNCSNHCPHDRCVSFKIARIPRTAADRVSAPEICTLTDLNFLTKLVWENLLAFSNIYVIYCTNYFLCEWKWAISCNQWPQYRGFNLQNGAHPVGCCHSSEYYLDTLWIIVPPPKIKIVRIVQNKNHKFEKVRNVNDIITV